MPETIENGIGMQLVEIPSGKFKMGGDPVAEQADENETPRRDVIFDKPFCMCRFQVTQSQWARVMKTDPSHFKGPDRPVETVSHHDALAFVERLNEMEGKKLYRLPTEAQWEYAARAGSQSAYCYGTERMKLSRYAWYKSNSKDETHPVGLLAPNDWGLHDMHGNVHEWCADWFDRNYYAARPAKDPKGPETGLARVLRGGDWSSEDWYCRCAIRSLSSPDRRSPRVGFRVVMLSP
jgi:formylglycine-generating enzyme required for sulfatase activity